MFLYNNLIFVEQALDFLQFDRSVGSGDGKFQSRLET